MNTGQPQTEFHCTCPSPWGSRVSGNAQSQKQGRGVVQRPTDLSFHWGSLLWRQVALTFTSFSTGGEGRAR